MARTRRWPDDAEQERADAIAYFEDLAKLGRTIEAQARVDPVLVEKLAVKVQLAAAYGKHILEMARPTKSTE
jgi:hypothetical protein